MTFDEHGRLLSQQRKAFLSELVESEVEDLFVFSHGWNTTPEQSRELYDAVFPLISEASLVHETLGRIGFAGIIWPSIWFPETDANVEGCRARSRQTKRIEPRTTTIQAARH